MFSACQVVDDLASPGEPASPWPHVGRWVLTKFLTPPPGLSPNPTGYPCLIQMTKADHALRQCHRVGEEVFLERAGVGRVTKWGTMIDLRQKPVGEVRGCLFTLDLWLENGEGSGGSLGVATSLSQM